MKLPRPLGLTLSAAECYKSNGRFTSGGAVAQLGARLDGIEEVEGSNPFGSTSLRPRRRASARQAILIAKAVAP